MDRRIDVEGCNNFRDIGGYPDEGGRRVRWRLLYRADALHHLSERGVSQLRNELRVESVVDLRSGAEVSIEGRGPLADEAIRFHHLPLFDGDATQAERGVDPSLTLADRYYLLARFAGEPIRRVLTTLAESDAPTVFHCAAGKDRTGVISALVLGLLGVPDRFIVADYAASGEALDAIVARLEESAGYRDMFAALPRDTLHAEPTTMSGFLARLREEYGSLREYAEAIGVPDVALQRLRKRLLD